MKNSVKLFTGLMSIVTAFSMLAIPAAASEKAFGWTEENGITCYIREDGSMVKKNTVIDGIRYKFGKDGECKGKYTGWTKTSKGRSYYKDGVKYKNRWVKFKSGKKYYIDADGYARTGWAIINGKGICFFNEKGVWDEKEYLYTDYEPETLGDYLKDCGFSADKSYVYQVDYTEKHKFPYIDEVLEIIKPDLDKELYHGTYNENGSFTFKYSKVYKGGTNLFIGEENSGVQLIFTKNKKGECFVHNRYYNFGVKLSDNEAFDKVKALFDKAKTGDEDNLEYAELLEKKFDHFEYSPEHYKITKNMYSDDGKSGIVMFTYTIQGEYNDIETNRAYTVMINNGKADSFIFTLENCDNWKTVSDEQILELYNKFDQPEPIKETRGIEEKYIIKEETSLIFDYKDKSLTYFDCVFYQYDKDDVILDAFNEIIIGTIE